MKTINRISRKVKPTVGSLSPATPYRNSDDLPVIHQVKQALLKTNRLATACGFILGAFVPVACYVMAHYEACNSPAEWTTNPMSAGYWLLVLGGLIYSAITVFTWACKAFRMPQKAVSFCVLLEGVMVSSHVGYGALGIAALFLLVCINGIATGCTLALDSKGR